MDGCVMENSELKKEEKEVREGVIDEVVKVHEENPEGEEDGACSDQELDELLNFSLGEFGKHVHTTTSENSQACQPNSQPASQTSTHQSNADLPSASNMQDFEDVFSEEFVAQAQVQLEEAMKLLSKEDPQLWQQLQGCAASSSSTLPAGGEEKDEGGEGAEGGSVEATLEDTLRRLRESTEQIESSSEGVEGVSDRLSQLLSQLGDREGGEGEDGEEGLVKMMEGMMGTLLSRDVLYPSLTEICKQYTDWLSSQRGQLSPEDYSRYCKQLEIMRAICQEFERQEREGGEEASGAKESNDRIFQLMQQLQQYGQPPPEIAGDSLLPGGLPGFPPGPFPGGPMPTDCSIM